MVCLPSEDVLLSSGVPVLHVLANPATLEDVAKETGLPLFRVRGTVRRLLEAGLTHQVGHMYQTTPEGIETLEKKGRERIV